MRDMAAVKLSDGRQVQSRNEHADPPGVRQRMDHEAYIRTERSQREPSQSLEQEGVCEMDHALRNVRLVDRSREREPPKGNRDGGNQASQRPGGGNVEQGAPVRDARRHSDDGPQSAK